MTMELNLMMINQDKEKKCKQWPAGSLWSVKVLHAVLGLFLLNVVSTDLRILLEKSRRRKKKRYNNLRAGHLSLHSMDQQGSPGSLSVRMMVP